jgi:hypothetical protein
MEPSALSTAKNNEWLHRSKATSYYFSTVSTVNKVLSAVSTVKHGTVHGTLTVPHLSVVVEVVCR